MPGYVMIPVNLLGTKLSETKLKSALMSLNKDMHFDLGGCKNIWHPYQTTKQGVWHKGKHICSMDRGDTIPEVPIWSTKVESVRVKACDMTYGEWIDPLSMKEVTHNPDGTETETGYFLVRRQVKDRLLFIGWLATIRKIVRAMIPGVTKEDLERELGIVIDWTKDIEEQEILPGKEFKIEKENQILLAS